EVAQLDVRRVEFLNDGGDVDARHGDLGRLGRPAQLVRQATAHQPDVHHVVDVPTTEHHHATVALSDGPRQGVLVPLSRLGVSGGMDLDAVEVDRGGGRLALVPLVDGVPGAVPPDEDRAHALLEHRGGGARRLGAVEVDHATRAALSAEFSEHLAVLIQCEDRLALQAAVPESRAAPKRLHLLLEFQQLPRQPLAVARHHSPLSARVTVSVATAASVLSVIARMRTHISTVPAHRPLVSVTRISSPTSNEPKGALSSSRTVRSVIWGMVWRHLSARCARFCAAAFDRTDWSLMNTERASPSRWPLATPRIMAAPSPAPRNTTWVA